MKNDVGSRLDKAEKKVRELQQLCGTKTQTGVPYLDDDLMQKAIDSVGDIDGVLDLLRLLLTAAQGKDMVLGPAAIDGLRSVLEKAIEAIYDVIDVFNQSLPVDDLGAPGCGGGIETPSEASSGPDSAREEIESAFNSGRALSLICRLLEAAAGGDLMLDASAADGLRLILEAALKGMGGAIFELEDRIPAKVPAKGAPEGNAEVENQAQECAFEGAQEGMNINHMASAETAERGSNGNGASHKNADQRLG